MSTRTTDEWTSEHMEQLHKDIFYLQGTLLLPSVPVEYLNKCGEILQKKHMEQVCEERALGKLCGFPPCSNAIKETKGKYRVSLSKKKMYDSTFEQQFCSTDCQKDALIFMTKLTCDALQLRPLASQIFGTDQPDPFRPVFASPATTINKPAAAAPTRQLPQQIWASKTWKGGVVERKPLPPVTIQPRDEVEKPSTVFPQTSADAVLIEGYAFSNSKMKLAKKYEKALQKDDDNVSDISDSDSDADAVDSSSCSSSDEEDEGPAANQDDLTLFANVWRKLSDWVSTDTKLYLTGRPLPNDLIQTETLVARRDAFGLQLNIAMRRIGDLINYPILTHIRRRITPLLRTFNFPESISTGNSREWAIIAGVLLVLTDEEKKIQTEDLLQHIHLPKHEFQFLLDIFTEVIPEDQCDNPPLQDPEREESPVQRDVATESIESQCRKCRRKKSKCICRVTEKMGSLST